jgi:hypothetical protein
MNVTALPVVVGSPGAARAVHITMRIEIAPVI